MRSTLDRNPDVLESVDVGLAVALVAVRDWPGDLYAAVDEVILASIDA